MQNRYKYNFQLNGMLSAIEIYLFFIYICSETDLLPKINEKHKFKRIKQGQGEAEKSIKNVKLNDGIWLKFYMFGFIIYIKIRCFYLVKYTFT